MVIFQLIASMEVVIPLSWETIQTADCTFRRHFGYAYIDVNSECSGRFEGASFCPEDTGSKRYCSLWLPKLHMV